MQPPLALTLAANLVDCDNINVRRCLVIEQQRCLAADRGLAAWGRGLFLLLRKRIQLRRKRGCHCYWLRAGALVEARRARGELGLQQGCGS